jgi:peptidoglycan-associated lipoprotein
MVRRSLSFVALTLLIVAPVCTRAQFHPHSKQPGVPNIDLYGGYSYVFNSFYNVNGGGMSGWDASLKFPIWRSFLGIKGDVSGFNKKGPLDLNTKNKFFLVGPQVGMHISTSTVFVHGLIGAAHLANTITGSSKSDSSFAVAMGAGLDAGMSRHLAWRVTGDFYNTHFQKSNDNIGEIRNSTGRFSTGPVFRF